MKVRVTGEEAAALNDCLNDLTRAACTCGRALRDNSPVGHAQGCPMYTNRARVVAAWNLLDRIMEALDEEAVAKNQGGAA